MPAIIYNSYAGGMNAASANPRLTPPDCCPLIVNGTVRSGFIEPRPSFTKASTAWMDGAAQHLFERGVYQGSGFYSHQNTPLMLYAFDGHILARNLASGQVTCLTKEKKPFSKFSRFVWFSQRGPYAIAQDGVSPPVIIRGLVAKQGTKASGVPCGTLMVDGWGRLAVASPDRTRIYFSNHEADPNAPDVLTFSEGTAYFKNARYFQLPNQLGRIMAMDYAPSFYGKSDLGPLVVFCEFGTRAYDVSLPRDQWTTQDIATTPLPSFGACSHGSVIRRGNDLVFSDQFGRIQTMKSAIRKDEDSRMKVIDDAVFTMYLNEDRELRQWRQSARFGDRILTTVLPRKITRDDGRWSVVHDALAVYQERPAPTEQEHVWDGLWNGLGFASIDTALVDGRERCFVVATDANGMNSLFELGTSTTGIDVGSKASRIATTATMRAVDMDAPFLPKSYTGCALRLGARQGNVDLEGFWAIDRRLPTSWFSDSTETPYATCNALSPTQPEPRINPPAPPKGTERFYEVQPTFRITGMARLDEVAIETSQEPRASPNKLNTSKCKRRKVQPVTACQFNPFSYAIT